MAVRFLGSAFAAGPALLVILALIVRRATGFDAGNEALKKLINIITYAMLASIFFVLLELFTAFYSQIPGHMHAFRYLFWGLEGHNKYTTWTWISVCMGLTSALLLVIPWTRNKMGIAAVACFGVFGSLWIEKGSHPGGHRFYSQPAGARGRIRPNRPGSFYRPGGLGHRVSGADPAV